ncbi:MAG: hypothetical protein EA396_04870 [Anaerolineaceae bacterium]|nr:MAG: hypothetical protein EA396_04870 [Anaerolineaceae bacterium]
MNFLRNLFGGGSGSSRDRDALYIFVQPKMCPEVVRVRINLFNDLSQTEDGYIVRKMVSATRCPFQAEVELHFDKKRNITQTIVTDGDMKEEADYIAWVEQSQ